MGKLTRLAPPVAMATLRTVAPAAASVGSAGATTGWAHRQGSSTSRGYGSDWRKVRLQVLDAEPLCRICTKQGRVTQATEVHHRESFTSLKDPRRLDRRNLEPICRPCHVRVSQRQASGLE